MDIHIFTSAITLYGYPIFLRYPILIPPRFVKCGDLEYKDCHSSAKKFLAAPAVSKMLGCVTTNHKKCDDNASCEGSGECDGPSVQADIMLMVKKKGATTRSLSDASSSSGRPLDTPGEVARERERQAQWRRQIVDRRKKALELHRQLRKQIFADKYGKDNADRLRLAEVQFQEQVMATSLKREYEMPTSADPERLLSSPFGGRMEKDANLEYVSLDSPHDRGLDFELDDEDGKELE